MRKQLLAIAFVVAIAALIQLGCGGGSTSSTAGTGPVPGSVVVFGGDAPLCSILSFTVTVTGITLTPQVGGTPASVLSAANPITLDFASLMDFSTMLSLSNVPPGTYSQLTVTLSNPQLTYLDTTKSPPALTTIAPSLSSLTVTISLSPAVTVVSNSTVGLNLDFNLLKSVQLTSGQINGNVTPTFTASLPAATSDNGFAEFEDLRGIVQTVKTTSTNPSFTGDFAIQPSTGGSLDIKVASSTKFDGVSGLSALTTGTFVQVHAFADSSGNIVAKEVEVEEQEDVANGRAAFNGLITSVTRDSSGNATQFNLFVREETPDLSSRVQPRSSLSVNVGTSTRFVISAQGANNGNFTFDRTTLGVGQQVVVHVQLPTGTGTATTADARSIFLSLQSVLGNLSLTSTTPVLKGTDGKSGGFTLIPCSPVFQSQPITVLTFPQTAFAGISDLSGLTSSQPILVVKGLVFYQQTLGSSGLVTWKPPATLEVAKQVHQLQ